MQKKIIASLAAIAAVTMGSQAIAGGPLANCNSGQPFAWGNGGLNIPYNPDQGDLGPVSNAQAVALVSASFQQWQDVSSATATYQNAGLLPVDVDITNFAPFLNAVAPDGLSAIVFDDTGLIFDTLFGSNSGILGFAGPEFGTTATCEITEGYSFLNGPSFTNATAAFDVIVHEFGHYSNLAHTDVNGEILLAGDTSGPFPNNTFGTTGFGDDNVETMYPFYFGPGVGTSSLERDDETSLSTIYPDPSFATDFGSVSGTIFAPNGTTRLTGVNVIARNVLNPFEDAISAISSDFTDDFSQADPVTGTYKIEGLTPGAEYALFVDDIVAGGFSTPPLAVLPGPEEFYNGADESNNFTSPDDPSVFTPILASAGVDETGVDIVFNSPGPGDPLDVGWDGNVQISLPFEYGICGATFNSVFINANGSLTFGGGDTDFTESVADMVNDPLPRIAGLWDDLDSRTQGSVFYNQRGNTFTVTWEDVPETFTPNSNTFSITLRKASNNIDVDYDMITATDGLAGLSCGGSVTGGAFAAVDLSEQGRRRINLKNDTAVLELFNSGNPVDLGYSTVRYNGTTNFEDNWAEDNDSIAAARKISLPFSSLPFTRYTEIEPTGGDVDFFEFTADEGTSLVLEIAGGSFDTLIGLFDYSGALVAIDDDGGAGVLSRIVFPVSESGTYYLAVTTFPDADFTGDGNSGGRYILEAKSIEGTVLALGDDTSFEQALDFSFPFQGSNWSSVFVNSNGNLTFGSGDTDFSESVVEFLNDQPRIAPLWDDLSPDQGGLVTVDGDASSFSVTFNAVPEFFASTGNTFTVTLDASGEVNVSYGGIASADSIVGVTEGGGAFDPGEDDLSAGGPLIVVGSTYEQFTLGDPFDLDGTAISFEN